MTIIFNIVFECLSLSITVFQANVFSAYLICIGKIDTTWKYKSLINAKLNIHNLRVLKSASRRVQPLSPFKYFSNCRTGTLKTD